jgi:predicted transglutaminase-like cysteine proteinase
LREKEAFLRTLLPGILAIALISFTCSVLAAGIGHKPWSEELFQYISKTYGPAAERRIRQIEEVIRDNYDKPMMTKLEVTNSALNRLPWITDRQKYQADDYWANPLETIATFGGDCEDIAIAKWVMLRHMGVPNENLRLAYAKVKRTGESHMVLLYVERPQLPPAQQRPLVLDNFIQEIKPGLERSDLTAVYVVDINNNVIVFDDDGSDRSIADTVEKAKFQKLDKIKQQIAASNQKFKELNGGVLLY